MNKSNNSNSSASAQSGADIDKARRAELLDKISALLEKTTANGCTEAEAIAAAALAEKLMVKYGLSLGELKAVDPVTACEQVYTELGTKRTHEAQYLAPAIAAFTDTKTWWHRQRYDRKTGKPSSSVGVVFLGLSADVQIATYLFKTIRAAMDNEWRAYWKRESGNSHPNSARKNFMLGMVERLAARLSEMSRQRHAA